jgi:hypothetical protein
VVDPLEKLVNRNIQLRAFILRIMDPEDLGHAVSMEVREEALRVLVPSATVSPDGTKQAPRLD